MNRRAAAPSRIGLYATMATEGDRVGVDLIIRKVMMLVKIRW